jgi:hypothetical protein
MDFYRKINRKYTHKHNDRCPRHMAKSSLLPWQNLVLTLWHTYMYFSCNRPYSKTQAHHISTNMFPFVYMNCISVFVTFPLIFVAGQSLWVTFTISAPKAISLKMQKLSLLSRECEIAPLRTLDDFLLEAARFQMPNIKDLEKWGNRVMNNLLYYQTNYFIVYIFIFMLVRWALIMTSIQTFDLNICIWV